MDATAILERPPIEDTLFGESRLVQAQGEDEPDTLCFCICDCQSSADKVTNSRLTSAAIAVFK
jgi:hypothetical protein